MSRASSNSEGPECQTTPISELSTRSAHLSGWPEPVHDVLDHLVTRVEEADAKTTRSEICAALVLDSYRAKTAAELSEMLKRYREAKIKYTGGD